MPILGDATVVIARVARSTSNALRVQLTTPDGTELAHAQQKGGVAVLLGYKTGGKSTYTLSSAAGDELRIAVGKTTTVTSQNTPIGKIVPADGAVRFESGGGTVLAVVQPHSGSKADAGATARATGNTIVASSGGLIALMARGRETLMPGSSRDRDGNAGGRRAQPTRFSKRLPPMQIRH